MAEGRIRVIALGVIVRPSDGAVLAVHFTEGEPVRTFYRPAGGGVEFGEEAAAAVHRELWEELGQTVQVERLLGVTESHFVVEGKRGHEIVFNWLVHFTDSELYAREEFTVTESNGEILTAHWVQLDDLATQGIPFYPESTASLIRELRHD